MRLCITFLLIAWIFAGCRNSVKDDLIDSVDDKCRSKSECVISMKNVTKFQWDKLYMFGAWTYSDSIAKKIKLPYFGSGVPDDYFRLLFVKGDKVCYEEDILQSDYFNSTIFLYGLSDSLDKAKINYFSPSTAVFNVSKSKNESGCERCLCYSFKHR